MKNKTIPINIWDDYVPVGEKQTTYAYVEDDDVLRDKQKESLEILLNHIKENNLLPNVETNIIFNDRWEINFENLTHELLSKLIKNLKIANLSVDNTPFKIYSES